MQDVDKWDADVRQLLEQFRFLPRWRVDDIMISFAATGGSVGAHVDHYDVFLLQAQGERRWMIDASVAMGKPAPDLAFQDDVAIKLLRDEKSIRFVFVGGGKRRKEIQDFAEREGLTNVRFEPYRPREEIADSLSAADLHLISLKDPYAFPETKNIYVEPAAEEGEAK